MMAKIIIYEPSDEEKQIIHARVMRMVNIMSGLTMEQKALALRILTDSFRASTGITSIQIERDEVRDENRRGDHEDVIQRSDSRGSTSGEANNGV